jgi:uncharacterized protein YbcV (DUF1398 family)
MFTLEQIKAAHTKVKSGADFPAYIQEIKKLGVIFYETYVSDGHTDYFGANNYQTTSPAKYPPLTIAETSNTQQFKLGLKEHQQGKTDFLTFIEMCATWGVDKWAVNMEKMTCTYYDKTRNEVLMEEIPQLKATEPG